jgi:tryptophan synthase alpha chain
MVLAQGIEKFFARCRFAGIDGVLIADLPAENIHEVLPAASESNVRLISLVSPVTSCERIELITKNASGFLYLVSRLGVTGTGRRDSESDALLSQVIAQIKARTAVPICAGFGVSTREQARNMLSLGADGVITGSRVIEIIRAAQPEEAATALYDFCCDMVQECSDFGVPSCRG